jgi:hypothetical protein
VPTTGIAVNLGPGRRRRFWRPARLWVPQTRLTSCDLLIFVEEARAAVESADASRVVWPLFWECA